MQTLKNKQWPWPTPEPGLYFNMSFEDYLSIPALQSSSIKELCLSDTPEDGAMDFWARSWMNPLKDEIDTDSQAKIDGRAYHKRILEGSTAFYQEYAPEYELPSDLECLKTSKDITACLKANDVKGYSGKTLPELCMMLQDIPYAPPALHMLEREHKNKFPDGVEFLKASTVREIELAAKMIECHPHLQKYFVGGYPEVTVIWQDPETGVVYKARFDYLKVGPGCDLKTFANQMRKTLKKAIAQQIASYKYYIQGALYIQARDHAAAHARAGRVFNADHVDPNWLDTMSKTENNEFWWIFQQKGIAPVAKGRVFDRSESLYSTGASEIERATDIFINNYNHYGTDPWIDRSAPERVSKDDIPSYAYD